MSQRVATAAEIAAMRALGAKLAALIRAEGVGFERAESAFETAFITGFVAVQALALAESAEGLSLLRGMMAALGSAVSQTQPADQAAVDASLQDAWDQGMARAALLFNPVMGDA
jgi:hypothetical protein